LSQRPELRIITRGAEEVSSDALSILEFEHYKATDYRLAYVQSEELFCIVSPKDIVMARPPDLDDHISWLISVERYEEALAAAKGRERDLRTHKLSELGQKYLHVRMLLAAPVRTLPASNVTVCSIYWRMIW
jgi:hypothetical protein